MNIKRILVQCCVVGMMSGLGWAESGRATLISTQPDSHASGAVSLEDTAGGLKIDAQITQAPPGEHAFHIHEFGLCDDAGKAAGSHYNPANHPHGNTLKDGMAKAHAGDFGNVKVGDDGKARVQIVVPGLALAKGPASVAGRAFILHEKVDDFSQPVGNAGNRIACGPILIVKP